MTIKAEGFETFCDVRMFLQHHKELEKENERQKAQITELEKKINTLKIKNASLQKKNEQQAKQIEKMKCCGCCKYSARDNDLLPCSECDGKSKWQLAKKE